MFAVITVLQPLARVVADDSFDTAQDDGVVGRGQLEVIVPDVATPVLRAGGFDETLGGFDGTDGAYGWKNDIGVLWEKMRGPCILVDQVSLCRYYTRRGWQIEGNILWHAIRSLCVRFLEAW